MKPARDVVQVTKNSPHHLSCGEIDLSEVTDSLATLGYNCEVPGSLMGMSGATHVCSVVCRGNATRIIIDFLETDDEDLSESFLLNCRAKSFDCAPDLTVVVCPHSLSDGIRELTTFYRFATIEASNSAEICRKLFQLLREHQVLEAPEGVLPIISGEES